MDRYTMMLCVSNSAICLSYRKYSFCNCERKKKRPKCWVAISFTAIVVICVLIFLVVRHTYRWIHITQYTFMQFIVIFFDPVNLFPGFTFHK